MNIMNEHHSARVKGYEDETLLQRCVTVRSSSSSAVLKQEVKCCLCHKDLAHEQQGPAPTAVFMDCWPIDSDVQLYKNLINKR